MKKRAINVLAAALLLSGQALAEEHSLHVGTDSQGTAQVQHSGSSNLNAKGYHNGNVQGSGYHGGYGGGNQGRNQAEVIVDLPPEAWQKTQTGNQPPCLRCCTYENRSYTEGSVVKMEGVLLQCRRDEQSIGTNNLIWQIVR